MAQTEDDAAIVAANDAFYRAFALRDVEAMDAVWARAHPVACIHPGWGSLSGRRLVMKSWRRILANPESPRVSCHRARVHQLGDAAFVTCFESVQGALLVATNVFVREDGAWRLAHHQAGPVQDEVVAGEEAEDDPRTLN
jgi:ketosteroid isomerase-like protein